MVGREPVLMVADRYYLIAHDQWAGRVRLHRRAVGLALAAGLLGELVLADCIAVRDGEVRVVRHPVPVDALAHTVLTQVAESDHTDVRVWLAYLAEDAADRVAARLARVGVLDATRRRRLTGVRTVYTPVDANVTAFQTVRLERLLNARAWLGEPDGFLTGLVDASGLVPHVLWDHKASTIGLAHVPHVIEMLSLSLHELVVYTKAAVGQLVLAPR